MRRLLVVLLVCFVALVFVSGAFAQEGRPCAGDVAKFCGDVKSGEGRLIKCLKEKKDQLSPECKAHVAKVKDKLKEVHKACEDDLTMFCAGVEPGEGRIMKCMREHKAELSSKCKAGIAKGLEERPCGGDVAKFCGDVKMGEGRIAKCLKENKDQLSPQCKAHIAKVKEKLKGIQEACEDDVTMFCAGVESGGGRIMKCLKEHKAELSSKCQEGITKAKGKKE